MFIDYKRSICYLLPTNKFVVVVVKLCGYEQQEEEQACSVPALRSHRNCSDTSRCVRMKVNIFCCLLACTLGSNVAAGLTHEGVKEGTQVTLRCPHSVKGGVRWSRESGGSRADILTADGDKTTKHINDPQKRYDSQADGSLYILRAAPSDSGRYFCNHEAAVELTVIPSGTTIVSVAERSSITLNCSHDVGGSAVPTWRRDSGEINEGRISVSTEDTTLRIRQAEPADSGLYYCDGEPAAYLNVTKGQRSDRAFPVQSFLIGTGLLLLSILILIAACFMWRCRSSRRGTDEQLHVYDEIPAGAELHLRNGGSDHSDPTYDTIAELPRTGNDTNFPHSLTASTFHAGNNKGGSNHSDATYDTIAELPQTGNTTGSSQPVNNTYVLLEKPKASRSRPDRCSFT
ncbi:hepatocyte cell adhesion molecule-like isoform X2 [Simochromis diagramma]|uniref:hepatocyte cell adhesion molecule-like isoform X2 n=1 Tax=Simochromis diagramma TaxID=43689 RepID=UPI001A7ECA3C|nr:hepatocyte cell adhesion molecule-like isoform X2 [Simochromis diagramma]